MKQQSKEWFEARKGRVTGSAVGAILGLSPFMTQDDVLRRMVREYHGAESEFKGNVATEYGTFNEDNAKFEYMLSVGNGVEDARFYTYEDWLGASPDGFIGKEGLIEIKCPYGQRDNNPPKFKSIEDQPHYYAQIQIQLFVTGRKWCHFFQWNQYDYKLECVEINQEWLDENLPKLKEFYALYLSELDNEEHLKPKRKEISNAHARQLIDEYDDLCEQLELANERKKEVLKDIIDLAGEVDAEICGRKLTKVARKGSISYAKAVKDNLPDLDLTPYQGKDSEFWKLT
jgi:putative phage-type endonuclease